MATKCFSSIQGLALRVTRLTECGLPTTGTTCDFAVSESFVTMGISAEIEESDEFILRVGNGRICLDENGCGTLKNYQIEMEVCNADPDFFNIITGVDRVYDFNDDVVGFEINQSFGTCERFALELWTKAVGDSCLDPTGAQQYIYWLLPCVANGRIGDITIENGPLTWTLTGEAIPNTKWGVGPYFVVSSDVDNTPSPLLFPLEKTVALHVQYTTIPPPTEVCGCRSLFDLI